MYEKYMTSCVVLKYTHAFVLCEQLQAVVDIPSICKRLYFYGKETNALLKSSKHKIY